MYMTFFIIIQYYSVLHLYTFSLVNFNSLALLKEVIHKELSSYSTDSFFSASY